MSIPDYKARIILLGNCNVGKTSYVRTFIEPFDYKYRPTVGVEYGTATAIVNNDTHIKCQIWDTAGNEKFASIISCYYKNIAGVIIMFDITNKSSFNNCNYWVNEFNNNKNSDKYISKLLIGNKLDLEHKRQISKKEAEIFAKKIGFHYTEISTKKNVNKYESINFIAEDIHNKKDIIESGIEDMYFVDHKSKIIIKNDKEWCAKAECPSCCVS
mgnify:CR=1 FL=1